MAKRIEFIAPVEAVRGNLSGAQKLEYAENNNPAYYSPEGKKNYARNYTARYIGVKRASDGRKYFQVRLRNAVNMTPKAVQAMALLGGTGAIVGYILRDKSSIVYNSILAQYIELNELSGHTLGSLRNYMSRNIRQGLVAKTSTIPFPGPRPTFSINNPFVNPSSSGNVMAIGTDILVKFYQQLGPTGASYFYVNSMPGIFIAGETFASVMSQEEVQNVLNIVQKTIGPNPYVGIGDNYIINEDGTYVLVVDEVQSKKYGLTPIAPQA